MTTGPEQPPIESMFQNPWWSVERTHLPDNKFYAPSIEGRRDHSLG
jgi:hypothetical protein